jgi:hypothetical protein
MKSTQNQTLSKHMRSRCFQLLTFFLILLNSSCNLSSNSSEEQIIEQVETCLIGNDWVYPSGNNPSSAWKFNSDRTFNFSTTLFGGMSTWGTWSIVSPTRISIHYTKATNGYLPEDQSLDVNDCQRFSVGTTTYTKQ